jgi:GTP-binding protein
VRLLVLLTKADKLNTSERQRALQAAQAMLADMSTDSTDIAVTPFSALSRQGVGDVAEALHAWVLPSAPLAADLVAEQPVPAA